MTEPEYESRLKKFNLHNLEEIGRDEPMSGATYVVFLAVAAAACILAVTFASFVLPS